MDAVQEKPTIKGKHIVIAVENTVIWAILAKWESFIPFCAGFSRKSYISNIEDLRDI